ncbi:7845_t:CDS:2, partial [Acaulospora colombiana]
MRPKGTSETTLLLTNSNLDCSESSTTPELTEDNDSIGVLIEPEVETGAVESMFSWSKLWKYTGPGFLMSIAYLDPGNLEADLQIGAVAGYSLLWTLLYAHIAGLLIQCLAARIGVVSGQHLAQLIRCHYPRYISIILWLITEIAIIGSDIQEIVGTAIALRIILKIPLWLGTMLTALDTFAFMLLQNYGMRKLEAFFMALIATMASCFWIEMFLSGVDVKEVAVGILVPSVPRRAIIQVVAMVGAVFAQVFYAPGENKHLPGLYDAGNVLSNTLGYASKYLWAFGLLAAGQSSTMAGTLAGQYVIEGFFGKVLSQQWYRNAITRSIALVPSMLVAIYAV